MSNKYFLSAILLASSALVGCVTTDNNPDVDTIGLFTSVVFNVTKIGANKYTLEATTAHGADEKELLAAYQKRAAKLCQPHTPVLNYKFTTDTYMATVNPVLRVPMTAPKITGIVSCK